MSLKARDFSSLYSRGRRFHTNNFVIFYRKNNKKISRYGISVRKKCGKAPFRNSIKRKIRSLEKLLSFPGYDLIFSCRIDISNSYYIIKEDIFSLWDRIIKN